MRAKLAWLGVLVAVLGTVTVLVTRPGTSSSGGHTAGLASIPLTARGAVSAALGSSDVSYKLRESTDGHWQAANAAQSLRASFGRSGTVVGSNGSRVGLRLAAIEFGGRPESLAEVTPRDRGSRLVYSYPGVSEWYANGPLGLEQGFTVPHPAVPESATLTLSMAVSGDLRPSLSDGGVLFARDGRAVLAYRDLVVTDAVGRRLRSSLAVADNRLEIKVDTSGAAYPVRIDPLLQQAELSATDVTAGSHVGESVAVSSDGSTVVVGAPNATVGSTSGQGAVYVFTEPAGGWASGTQTAMLTSSSGTTGDEFGVSVAVSGDGSTVVVGAPEETVGSNADQGSAYVYSKPGGGWASGTQTATLSESSGASGDKFGSSVSVSSDGSTVVSGAPQANSNGGAAYVFSEPGGGWASATPRTQTASLTTTNSGTVFYLGYSVAVSSDGSTVAIGAPDADVAGNSGQGEVFLFSEPGGGWASEQQTSRLSASDGVSSDNLGASVAVSEGGSTVVAGALYEPDSGGLVGPGAAYVFSKPAQGWGSEPSGTQSAKLTASGGEGSSEFGETVAVSSAEGSTVLVGAPFQDVAYVFPEPAGGWASEPAETQSQTLSASNGVDFGTSVASSDDGSILIAGAIATTTGSSEGPGAAYVFGSGSSTTTPPSITTPATTSPATTSPTVTAPAGTTTTTSAATTASVGSVVTSGTTATVPLSCSGPAGSSCTVKLSLSVTETVQGGKVLAVTARAGSNPEKKTKKPKKTKKRVVLGDAAATVLTGHTSKVKVSLDAQGKSLLAKSHKLSVDLVVTKAQDGSTKTVSTRTLTFRAPEHRKK